MIARRILPGLPPLLALLVAAPLLAGCAATQDHGPATLPPPSPPAVPPEEMTSCRNEALAPFIGRSADEQTGAEILKASGARRIRWVAPGMAVTMDFRPDRVTVSYDSKRIIVQASCG